MSWIGFCSPHFFLLWSHTSHLVSHGVTTWVWRRGLLGTFLSSHSPPWPKTRRWDAHVVATWHLCAVPEFLLLFLLLLRIHLLFQWLLLFLPWFLLLLFLQWFLLLFLQWFLLLLIFLLVCVWFRRGDLSGCFLGETKFGSYGSKGSYGHGFSYPTLSRIHTMILYSYFRLRNSDKLCRLHN